MGEAIEPSAAQGEAEAASADQQGLQSPAADQQGNDPVESASGQAATPPLSRAQHAGSLGNGQSEHEQQPEKGCAIDTGQAQEPPGALQPGASGTGSRATEHGQAAAGQSHSAATQTDSQHPPVIRASSIQDALSRPQGEQSGVSDPSAGLAGCDEPRVPAELSQPGSGQAGVEASSQAQEMDFQASSQVT